MFILTNLAFSPIINITETVIASPGYMEFMKDIKTDYQSFTYRGWYGDVEAPSYKVLSSDAFVIRTVSIPSYSEQLVDFEQYTFTPIGNTSFKNTVQVYNYNNLKFNKNNKYILNMYPVVGEFVNSIDEVLEDGTNVKDIYFEILEKLTTGFNADLCLFVFQFKNISSTNDLTLVCNLQSGGESRIRFNINE